MCATFMQWGRRQKGLQSDIRSRPPARSAARSPACLQISSPFTSLTFNERESSTSLWLSPSEALHLAAQRTIQLPPPTTYLMRELEHMRTIEDVYAKSVTLTHQHRSAHGREQTNYFASSAAPMLICDRTGLLPALSLSHSPSAFVGVSVHDRAITVTHPHRIADGTDASAHHMALPGDPCYDLHGTGIGAAYADATDSSKWHRMLRSKDEEDARIGIHRPAHMTLRTAEKNASKGKAKL
jgi:hypothetical protein